MSTRLTPLGWITGVEGALLCLVPAWQMVPLAAVGGVAMLATVGAARWLAPRALRQVRAEWVRPKAVYAGVETTLAARVSATRAVPPVDLLAWDPRTRVPRLVARLSGIGPAESGARWSARFPARGAVTLPPLIAQGAQPFGLIEAQREAGAACELIVLPPLGRVRAGLRTRLAEWFSGVATAPELGGDDLGRLRDWAAGDSRNRIHWRASARHQRLLVAERHAPGARRLAIALDPLASATVYERLVSAAATLVDDLDRRGWELAVHHGHAPHGAVGDRDRLLEALALARPGGAPIDEIVPRGMPCLALLADASAEPENQPPPMVVRDQQLPRLIHLPRRLGRSDA